MRMGLTGINICVCGCSPNRCRLPRYCMLGTPHTSSGAHSHSTGKPHEHTHTLDSHPRVVVPGRHTTTTTISTFSQFLHPIIHRSGAPLKMWNETWIVTISNEAMSSYTGGIGESITTVWTNNSQLCVKSVFPFLLYVGPGPGPGQMRWTNTNCVFERTIVPVVEPLFQIALVIQ